MTAQELQYAMTSEEIVEEGRLAALRGEPRESCPYEDWAYFDGFDWRADSRIDLWLEGWQAGADVARYHEEKCGA